jgi:hypothetical protein
VKAGLNANEDRAREDWEDSGPFDGDDPWDEESNDSSNCGEDAMFAPNDW